MTLKQISVFLENRMGQLEILTECLAKNNINMRALSLAETSEFGIVRIIVDNVEAASALLTQENFVHTITNVLGVAIPALILWLNERRRSSDPRFTPQLVRMIPAENN